MSDTREIPSFSYHNIAGELAFGRGTVDRLASMLTAAGGSRALVVCGEHVGANENTVGPVEAGLGEAFGGLFDGTKPSKTAEGAFDGLEAAGETDADALVAVGGGSSIDVARAMSGLYDRGSPEAVRAHVDEHGSLPVSDDPLPLLAVPTTLAGADLSTGGSITFYEGVGADNGDSEDENGREPLSGGYGDPALMPDGLVYDPDLFDTTPTGVLTGSAMNGFDKGIELPYSKHANPLTDAPALRGLSLLASSLPELGGDADPAVMERAVAGIICVQYGRATTNAGLLSVIHAFGHGLRAEGIQQGIAHAVMAPPVLEFLFERVEGRRELLADALDVDDADPATGIVERVRSVRDGMDLPSRLGELDELDREALPQVAAVVENDRLLANVPEGFDPTREDIEAVLDAAW